AARLDEVLRIDSPLPECIMRLPVHRPAQAARPSRQRPRAGALETAPTRSPSMSMSQAKIEAFERTALRADLPDFRVGDTVAVHYKIVEGDKLRVQIFRGVVIKRHRAGVRSTVTVRKTSFSVGVER